MDSSKRPSLSSFRFEALKQAPARAAPEQPAAQLPPEQAAGRYVELTRAAREGQQEQTFGKAGGTITQEAIGAAKAHPAEPMRKDAAPLDQLIAKPPPGRQPAVHGSPAPGGSLWNHAPGASAQTRRPDAPGSGTPGTSEHDGKKLEFFRDRNPDHDKGHDHSR